MSSVSRVLVKEEGLVRPKNYQHVERKRTMLSTMGHFAWCIHYRRRFLFFRHPQGGRSLDDLCQQWKESLAKVLVDFYPVAGRLIVREDGRMELDLQGQGIHFAQAQTEATLSQLGDDNFDGIPTEFLLQLAQTGGFVLQWPWSADAPLFFIQVTQFSCGGICIAISFGHQLLDGVSGWHFVQAWAETCCGKDLTMKPKLVDLPIPIVTPPGSSSTEVQRELDELGFLKIYKRQRMRTLEDISSGKHLVTKSFTFSAKFIAGYKEQHPGFTKFQLLTSLLWHKMTLARDNLAPEEITTLRFAVNCRGKVESIPPEYLGEAAALISATMDVGSLRASSHKAASLIKETIAGFTKEKIGSYMKLVEKFAGDQENAVFVKGSGGVGDVTVGSSFYFPVYEDFAIGRPDGMTILPTPNEGRVYYFPGLAPGSVSVYISGTSDFMDRLKVLLSGL